MVHPNDAKVPMKVLTMGHAIGVYPLDLQTVRRQWENRIVKGKDSCGCKENHVLKFFGYKTHPNSNPVSSDSSLSDLSLISQFPTIEASPDLLGHKRFEVNTNQLGHRNTNPDCYNHLVL